MTTPTLPPDTVMIEAFLSRDSSFDGLFLTGVQTTGIFCRTTCPARRPKPRHLRFFASAGEALRSGYRPCMRCRPLEPAGAPPRWLRPLLAAVEEDPARRWTDARLRGLGFSPGRVRRWFQAAHGMTFHAYSRARRLAAALGRIDEGDAVARAAFDSGYDSLSGFQEAFRVHFGAPPTQTTGKAVVRVDRVVTPLGPMLAGATEEALVLLEFADRPRLPRQIDRIRRGLGAAFVPGRNGVLEETEAQLAAYFEGTRRDFDLPVAPVGTEFQKGVWAELQRIGYGQTRSYADIARALGRPKAVRGVGRANGDNALAVVIPCHRVVGADGRLVGYGGGLWRKRRLLELEGAVG